ncbi:MAG TPA: hypothetical protein VIS96_01155 [Terrimicrobiaceae bacterium]
MDTHPSLRWQVLLKEAEHGPAKIGGKTALIGHLPRRNGRIAAQNAIASLLYRNIVMFHDM